MIRFLLFIFCFIFITDSFALQINQIVRTKDKKTRQSALKEQNRERMKLRRIARSAKDNLSFYIHEPIVCATNPDKVPTEEALKITQNSRISLQEITNRPEILYLFIQIIKAHLDISRTIYKSGKFIATKSVRYHTDEELKRYPDSIVKDSVEDAFASIYYINYVLMPLIETLITPEEKEDLLNRLSFLMNPGVYEQKYTYYEENVLEIKKLLNQIFREHLPTYKTKLTPLQIKAFISIRLLHEAMQSYQNSTSCSYFTKLTNPQSDPYKIDLPDYHNNYVMGYGLFRRAELILSNDILASKNISYDDRVIITEVIQTFKKLYPKIIRQDGIRVMPSKAIQDLNKLKALIKQRFF